MYVLMVLRKCCPRDLVQKMFLILARFWLRAGRPKIKGGSKTSQKKLILVLFAGPRLIFLLFLHRQRVLEKASELLQNLSKNDIKFHEKCIQNETPEAT